jgi:hypothetical protein
MTFSNPDDAYTTPSPVIQPPSPSEQQQRFEWKERNRRWVLRVMVLTSFLGSLMFSITLPSMRYFLAKLEQEDTSVVVEDEKSVFYGYVLPTETLKHVQFDDINFQLIIIHSLIYFYHKII